MKIIYFAQLNQGGTDTHRCDALKRLGHDVKEVKMPIDNRIAARILDKFSRTVFHSYWQSNRHSQKFIQKLDEEKHVDCIWIDKGTLLKKDALLFAKKKFPNAYLIHYSPDDMFNPDNQTKDYLSSIPVYDLHITTKSYNVDELYEAGAKDVLMIDNSYEPTIHKPSDLKNSIYASVSFIGSYEKERSKSILFLCNNGIKVSVWGSSWKGKITSPNLEIYEREILNDEYANVISNSLINLCFLRKVNRDLQTTRSIEIPACGGFMLAERTMEHLSLFKEAIEADFFSTDQELLEKAIFYLKNNELREKIAKAGYRRCITSGYSNDARLKKVFDHLNSSAW
jgi:spore maturation protein CgeB